MEVNVAALTQKAVGMTIEYVPKVALAILTLVIGFWVIKRIVSFIEKSIGRSGIDQTLSSFMSSLFSVGLKVMLLLSVAGMFGVNTTSFLAILGGLMVGIGMAINGTLGHVASGLMLMVFKPFKVGDLVVIGGGATTGTVLAINAFNTTLKTLDNKRIIIANTSVTDNDITNISGQGVVGVELTFGIGYSDSIDDARRIILEVGHSCPHILSDPAQAVVVSSLGDSSVNLSTRPFCNSENYWKTMFYMQEHVKKEFDNQGVGIPFPQMDVHMIPAS